MKYASGATLIFAALLAGGPLWAGYEQPSYIDGCRSQNGRYEVTAELLEKGKTSHGPHRWQFVWKDLQENRHVTLPATGVQGGQIYAQLFIAPNGETFALWNHQTMYWAEKSHMHASSHSDVVKREKSDTAEFRGQPIFSNRLIIYRKDGSIVKSLQIADFIHADEWKHILPVFNRVEWLRPYEDFDPKKSPRQAYAFTRVSSDYSVMAIQVGDRKSPREVFVSLIDGEILTNAPAEKTKTPVRMFQGEGSIPKGGGGDWLESYLPSIDPVREAGTYNIETIQERYPSEKSPKKLPKFEVGEVKPLVNGLTKGDTPTWLESFGKEPDQAGRLLFTDLEANTLYSLFPGAAKNEIRTGATRGRIHGGRTFYGLIDGKICSWDVVAKSDPRILLSEGIQGREVSLNDLAVSERGLVYFTTLKDPEKGRLSLLNPTTGKITVLFDGEMIPHLANPNGVALNRTERFLYVGISNYKNRKHSGVYAFPIRGDGTIDVEAGRAKPRIPIKAPDGIAVDRADNIYFTAGNTVHVYTPFARPLAKIKIPEGSGTNLCFGGNDRIKTTLFITTWNGVYAVETPTGQ